MDGWVPTLNKPALRPCPICRTSAVDVLHRQLLQQPEASLLPGEYDVVACPQCGMVYADTPVAQDAYDSYYEEQSKYEDPAVATGGGSSELDRTRLEQLADRIAERAAPTARILDIGCASGGLLDVLRRRGFRSLHGVDAAPACVEQVRRMGLDATRAVLSQLSSAGIKRPFDVIVVSHVLEHVVDLSGLMASVKKLLAPDGLIYAETPDAARYADFPFVPFYFFDSEHINHFDTIRLDALGSAFGFHTQAAGTVELAVGPNVSYPACWVWMRLGTGDKSPAKPANSQLAAAVERYIEDCRRAESFPQLERLAATGTPVIIWGAGSFAQRLFGGSRIQDCKVIAVVDRDINKQGLNFAGFVVQSPEAALTGHPDATVVIVAAIHGPAIAAEVASSWPNAKTLLLAPSGQEQRGIQIAADA
jgi:SAM-dependent methyltransferase